jgi:dTDP-4-dehydrorhamnose 3,5-epimerase
MPEPEFDKALKITPVKEIAGMLLVDLTLHGDNRGWFKENWQRAKMTELGLPADFTPVQNNFSFNVKRGVTRGLHAEPWDKFISLGSGRIFGAWADLRAGSPTYGQTFTAELDPSKAIFVPRGVANGFQTLTDDTVYTYLVNAHWSPTAKYTFVNLADPDLKINWPISLDKCELSDKDKTHPFLKDVRPMPTRKTMITGAYGQLGRALAKLFPDATQIDRDTLDLTDENALAKIDWSDYDLILNAAAYTNVDGAETDDGRHDAWAANVTAVKNLAKVARANNLTLVHISSDYVFDGQRKIHDENEPLAPLSVYGQTKAAADSIVLSLPKFYLIRTSWVIGDGHNFVRTMLDLAAKNVKPKVVDDQIGRLTFTSELARGIKFLLDSKAPYGLYDLTGDGDSASWNEITREIYRLTGHNPDDVSGISTADYYRNADHPIAPRPHYSTLDLGKIKTVGFAPRDWHDSLTNYIKRELKK